MEKFESYSNNTKVPNGEVTERKVLGYQETLGFNKMEKEAFFEKDLNELVENLYMDGFVELIKSDYPKSDNLDENGWKELINQVVKKRFLKAKDLKPIQEKNQHEKNISTFIEKHYTFGKAATQIRAISILNEQHNQEEYNKNISTPFTLRLVNGLKLKLQNKVQEQKVKVFYYTTLFHSPDFAANNSSQITKSYIDAMRGIDAFVMIERIDEYNKTQRDVFYIDYTGKPKKTSDERKPPPISEVIVNGMKHKKIIVFLEASKVDDEHELIGLGGLVANTIESHIA
jgi:hypothetical protein